MLIIIKNHFLMRIYGFFSGLFSLKYRFKHSLTSSISRSAKIIGWRNVSIGINTVICDESWININDRSTSEKKFILGNNSFIGKNNFFSIGNKVVIRDYCLTTSNCSFICSTHIIDDPLRCYISTGIDIKKSIYIGVNCFFGVNSSVVGDITIGHGSIIGANTIITKNIPPFSIVIGNPGVVIKRFCFITNKWVSPDKLSMNNPELTEDEYLRLLKSKNNYPTLPSLLTRKYFSDII
ncbi:acyltransferase [Providencia rettgeri]